MIRVSGNEIKADAILNQFQLTNVEKNIVEMLSSSNETYEYKSLNQLKFELNLRQSIIDNAEGLYRKRLRFRIFRESECNEDYWERMDDGGFALKEGVLPSDAIKDIYRNTSRYGTECATAIMIVFYKAVLDIYKDDLFNKLFPEIYLMNWQNIDNLLGVATHRNVKDYLPGDCRYFINPDVDPLTPEWQGENTIDLSNGRYYGHGIGINNSDGIINTLNKNRIAGSEVSAYLLNTATRPDFEELFNRFSV